MLAGAARVMPSSVVIQVNAPSPTQAAYEKEMALVRQVVEEARAKLEAGGLDILACTLDGETIFTPPVSDPAIPPPRSTKKAEKADKAEKVAETPKTAS